MRNSLLPCCGMRSGAFLLEVTRDLREAPVRLILALVDAVDYPGDGISRVHARGGPRRALATVDDAYLLLLLLRMHAWVHQPHHHAVGHCHLSSLGFALPHRCMHGHLIKDSYARSVACICSMCRRRWLVRDNEKCKPTIRWLLRS